jgi:predicted nucleotidyltransferase
MVDQAVRRWVEEAVQERSDVLRVGYFGSYARGDWSVGSDLDLVMVIKSSTQPFEKRAAQWDTTGLPVPTELLVYTEEEWRRLDPQSRFYQTLLRETVWVYLRENA